ncbi:hypothetical protein GYB57_15090 [bacterium]|nr:hypothetical protein [bacterium]
MRIIRTYFGILSIILTINICHAQTNKYCNNFNFESFEVQADSINLFMEKAVKSNSEEKSKWERKFFCAFPNSYASMDSLFGFNEKAGPLYYSETPEQLQFFGNLSSHIDFFSRLNSIPSDEYYVKYVNICIDGYWQADNIRVAFGFGLHLLNNPEPSCEALSKKSDKEIKSVFRFIFDSIHPDHDTNRKFYEKLLPIVKAENERLSNLLTSSYKKLMSENHDH